VRCDAAADWVFLVDTLNYCFWAPEGQARFAAAGPTGAVHAGYWALPACVNRALAAGVPLLDYAYLAQIDDAAVAALFRSANGAPVPLLAERAKSLREIGAGMLRACAANDRAGRDHGGDGEAPGSGIGGDGEAPGSGIGGDGEAPDAALVALDAAAGPRITFATLVREAGGSAARLIERVLELFPSYRDTASHPGVAGKVCIYKRAQILVADLWGCFGGRGLGAFDDIGELTMFADYRVPQILAAPAVGAIHYSPALLARLRADPHLAQGEREEVEIRACSIIAVERARARLAVVGGDNSSGSAGEPTPAINSVLIDFYLWGEAKARAQELRDVPIHKTWGVFY
jgi:hypothetical protein